MADLKSLIGKPNAYTSNRFNAAFFLTTCAFQIPYGRAYTILSTRWVFLSSILIFEIGSAVCGAAPTSTALIIGRAIAGIGGAGLASGCFIIIASISPLRKRSLYVGFLGAVFVIASVVGPILG
jgi:MFS family permease